MTEQERQELEDQWRRRITAASARLRLARDAVKEAQKDLRAIPSPDGDFAYRRALRAETEALAERRLALRIFTDLVMRGQAPDAG